MPLSRLTQTLPLACAAAISGLEFPGAVLVLLGADDVVGTGAVPGEFASGVEAAGTDAGVVPAGSVAESVAVRWRRFLCFFVVSDFVSPFVACAISAGETAIASST